MRNGVYGSDIPFSESNMVYVHNSDLADVMGMDPCGDESSNPP